MQERIVNFISALRSKGVRISLAESVDALLAVEKTGIQDREMFRIGLRATLIKEATDLPRFNHLFPLFFDIGGAPALMNLTEDLSKEEGQQISEALQLFSSDLREMLEKIIKGEPLTQQELNHLGESVGLRHANDFRYQAWMARRMQQAMGIETIRAAIQELITSLIEMGMAHQRANQIRQIFADNEKGLLDQLNEFAGRRIAESLIAPTGEENLDRLLNRPFSALTEKDMLILRKEVSRIASVLRTRAALRQKRAKSGQLDPKASIRANLKHAGVPIELKFRDRHIKPKLIVLCDVSTSMRYCSELMLGLLHAIQDHVKKTHAFAFIDHLEYISPDLKGKPVNEAVGKVLARMPSGYYSTDLGYSLLTFAQKHLEKIDSKTSFILVGDGRNNYNNPQVEVFRTVARRSNRTIWINPEPQSQWGSGDSDMWQYAPYCDNILRAGTLKELTSAVDKLLS